MQNDNLSENLESREHLLKMRNGSFLAQQGFDDDGEQLPQDSNYLTPTQIRTRDYSKNANEVRIPLGILKSRGFDIQRVPPLGERVFCGCFSLLLRLVLAASLASFLFGFNIALLNTCLDTISMDFKWCELPGDTECSKATLYKALISTAVFVGGAIGATTGGRFFFIGRRMTLLLIMIIISVGITTSIVADSLAVLIWARLIVGYGVGVVSVIVPIYISEISPPESRGFYGAFHQLFLTIGIFVAVLIGFPLTVGEIDKATYELPQFNRIWWRCMLGFGFIPVIFCSYLFLFAFNFETPHYYVENQHPNEARKILQILYNKSNVDVEVDILIRNQNKAAEASKGMSLRKALTLPLYRKVIFIGCLLAALQQFTGITVLISSSTTLFKSAVSQKTATLASIIITGLNFVMTIPGILLIDVLGRKLLMMLGTLFMGISLLPATTLFWLNMDAANMCAVVGSVFFIVFFSSTYGAVLWVYLFEIYPANIKGSATGLAAACNWLAGIFTVFAAQFVPIKINFTVFCITSFLTCLFVQLQMKETKGRSLESSPYWE